MQSRVFAVLVLLFSFCISYQANAELVKIAVLSTQNFHESMKQWQSTATYLSNRLPQHVFQVLPYSNPAEIKTDLEKNKLDFLLTANSELPQFIAEFAVIPVLNTRSLTQGTNWTLARNQQLPYRLTYGVSNALINMPAKHKAMQRSAINGWQLSTNTQVAISTGQKLKQLYNTGVELVSTLFKQYWTLLLACLLSCLLIVLFRKWDHYHRNQQVKKHRQQNNDPSLSDTVF